jgi:hypothetical protein
MQCAPTPRWESDREILFKQIALTRRPAIIRPRHPTKRLSAGGIPVAALDLHDRCVRAREGDQFGAEIDVKLEVQVLTFLCGFRGKQSEGNERKK